MILSERSIVFDSLRIALTFDTSILYSISPSRSLPIFEHALTSPPDEETYTEEGEEFKSTLQSFVRLYGFLSQVIDWQDSELEKMYAYGRYLLTKLPYRSNSGLLKLDGEIELSSYRNELTFEGSAALILSEPEPVNGLHSVKPGGVSPDNLAPLSTIVDNINDRFGTNWANEDQLLFEQISADMSRDDDLVQKARVNTKEQFSGVFKDEVTKAFASRLERNEKIVEVFMSNPDVRNLIIGALLDDVYNKARAEEI